jgi:hypothetical protein
MTNDREFSLMSPLLFLFIIQPYFPTGLYRDAERRFSSAMNTVAVLSSARREDPGRARCNYESARISPSIVKSIAHQTESAACGLPAHTRANLFKIFPVFGFLVGCSGSELVTNHRGCCIYDDNKDLRDTQSRLRRSSTFVEQHLAIPEITAGHRLV